VLDVDPVKQVGVMQKSFSVCSGRRVARPMRGVGEMGRGVELCTVPGRLAIGSEQETGMGEGCNLR
jgi:hypothetical protein